MFLCTSGGPCRFPLWARVKRCSGAQPPVVSSTRDDRRLASELPPTREQILVCKLPQNLTRSCRCRYRACAARRWRPLADAGGAAATRRRTIVPTARPPRRLRSIPLTGTPARYSAISAARERRAHHEQPAAGTPRSTKTGGEPRARRPSGRQDRSQHAAPLIRRAACFQESSRIPTTDAQSMCLSTKEASLTRVSPSSRQLLRRLRDRKTTEPQLGNRHARDVSLSKRPWPSPARPSIYGPRVAIQFGCFVPAAISAAYARLTPGCGMISQRTLWSTGRAADATALQRSREHPFKRASTVDRAHCSVAAPVEATV
jgi:hypothetical protein